MNRKILDAICRVGVDIRPESMGVTWDDVANAIRKMPQGIPWKQACYTPQQ